MNCYRGVSNWNYVLTFRIRRCRPPLGRVVMTISCSMIFPGIVSSKEKFPTRRARRTFISVSAKRRPIQLRGPTLSLSKRETL
jgi:hypothetical protein